MSIETYKLTIEPQSPFVTPLDSDTIFGHIAWVVAYREGKEALKRLLGDFNDAPPFLLSSGFPDDMLPIPILEPLVMKEKKALAEEFNRSIIETEEMLKEIKGLKYIPINDLKGLIDHLSNIKLARYLLKNKTRLNRLWEDEGSITQTSVDRFTDSIGWCHTGRYERVIMRTSVDRFTGSAREGKLFDHSEVFYKPGMEINIWIRFFNKDYIGRVEGWFRELSSFGYGADLSTGSGQFTVHSFSNADGQLPETPSPDAFMTISNFTPGGTDPVDGYYSHIIKRGKLGGLWSVVSTDGVSKANVWKRPLVMFEAGSVFKFNGKMDNFYGRMVEGIYQANQDIIQYALAFPLGVRLAG